MLAATGRWVFVTALDDRQWLDLTSQTLQRTGGRIDYPIEVADRCGAMTPDDMTLTVLTMLVDHGQPWERDYVRGLAVKVLRATVDQPTVVGGGERRRDATREQTRE